MPVNAYGEALLSPWASPWAQQQQPDQETGFNPLLLALLSQGGLSQPAQTTGGGGGMPPPTDFSLGLDFPSDFMSSLGSLMDFGGTLASARANFGNNFNTGFGLTDLSGLASLGLGAFSGNPVSAAGGGISALGTLARLGGYPGLSAGLGALGGPISLLGSAFTGDMSGIPSGAVGTLSGLGSLLSTLGTAPLSSGIAAGTAGGAIPTGAATLSPALAGAGSALSAVAGALAIPAAVAGMILSNNMAKRARQAFNQARETRDIRQGMAIAWPQRILGTQAGAHAIEALGAPGRTESDADILRRYADQAFQGQAAGAAITRFLNTQGGKQSVAKIPGIDVSPWSAVNAEGQARNWINSMRLADVSARLGIPISNMPEWQAQGAIGGLVTPTDLANAVASMGSLGGPGTATSYTPNLPESFVSAFRPGNFENAAMQYFGGINPQFSTSQFGQLLSSMPRFNITSVSPAQQLANMQRINQEGQNLFATRFANDPQITLGSSGRNPYELLPESYMTAAN